ncbi:hypothetical protein BGX34_005650 [Mortierella sp. NVP85]|nr:hypothetical protein BGX34_005650 [Mortierella sp. NVP85]
MSPSSILSKDNMGRSSALTQNRSKHPYMLRERKAPASNISRLPGSSSPLPPQYSSVSLPVTYLPGSSQLSPSSNTAKPVAPSQGVPSAQSRSCSYKSPSDGLSQVSQSSPVARYRDSSSSEVSTLSPSPSSASRPHYMYSSMLLPGLDEGHPEQNEVYGCTCFYDLIEIGPLDDMRVILDTFLHRWTKRKVKKEHVEGRVRCYVNKMMGDRTFARSLKTTLEYHKYTYEEIMDKTRCPSNRCFVKSELTKIENAIRTYRQYNRILGEKISIWNEAFPSDSVLLIATPQSSFHQVLESSLAWEMDIVKQEEESHVATDDHMRKIQSDIDSALSIMVKMNEDNLPKNKDVFHICIVVGLYGLEVKYLQRCLQIWREEFSPAESDD